MGKRGNENAQMRREDYEALESSGRGRGGDDEEVTQGFERAPESVRAQRRIVSARRPRKRPDTTSDDGETKSPNPFANVSLVGGGAATPAAAPGLFSFGSSSKSSSNSMPAPARTMGFSFGGTNNSSSISKPPAAPTPGFSFGGTSTSSSSTKPSTSVSFGGTTSSSTAPSSSNTLQGTFQAYANALEQDFQKELSQYPIKYVQCLPMLDQYLDAVHCLESVYWNRAKQESGKTSSTTAASTTASTPFVFGVPTPASTVASTNTPATTAGAAETPAAPTTGGETPASLNAPSSVGKNAEADKDWKDLVVFDGVVHCYHHRGDKAAKFCAGTLKCQENVANKTRRMVMRNEASGKVELNVTIPNGMPVVGGVSKSKKYPSGIEQVVFISIRDADHGQEKFTLRRVSNGSGGSTLGDELKRVANF
jgi:hypothetical protein